MDTVQIQHALQDVNSFLGVYASDLLPLSIVQTGTIVVNTDPGTDPGLHWQAAILLFPPSKISYDAIVQSVNTTERNSNDLPLQSVPNIAASSLCTWKGATPPTICGAVCC